MANVQYNKTPNWPSKLAEIVDGLNRTPSVVLGWLAPNDVQSSLDEPRVRQAIKVQAEKMTPKQREKYLPKPDSYKEMQEYAEKYETEEQLWRTGQFCYADKKPQAFNKATDEKRRQVFIINRILTNRKIKLFFLVDLQFKPVTGSFYSSNLRKVPTAGQPTSTDFYR
jgi:hypothetical protein